MNAPLMHAHNQWRSRPDDERYVSLDAMYESMLNKYMRSKESVVSSRIIGAVPKDRDTLQIVNHERKTQVALDPTNWSFGQLAQLSGAPASYLRTLPAPIAADCINYGMQFTRSIEDVGVYLTMDDDMPGGVVNSFNGPNYGRVFNVDIVNALRQRFGDGRTGDFRVPGVFGKLVDVTKENTTLYASDRDMFVFLADEVNRIEMRNRRDGNSGSLARGFCIGNSEVGARSLMIFFFLFDYVCENRMIWGVEEFKEFKIRHTKSAPDRWLAEIMPIIHAFSQSSTKGVNDAIHNAQLKKLDDVDEFLASRFGAKIGPKMKLAHEASEGRPVVSLWDAVTAATEFAKTIQHQDARIELEREAGTLLRMAA